MSMRVRVTSSRSAGDTGLTLKPRWSEACTSPSATSRDKASRTAVRLTENCFASPAMWSFWPGTSLVDRMSARRALQHGGGQGPGAPTSLHVKTDRNAVHGGQDGSGQNNRQSKIDFLPRRYGTTAAALASEL